MKFNRILTLVLAAACTVALVACKAEGSDVKLKDGADLSTVAPVEPVPEPQPLPEPAPEPILPYVNPLTGQGCQTEIGRNRPIAVMLNNLKKAMPQLGVSQADLIYEMPAEGGITRMMALYQSLEGVGQIGTVRSARDYYVSLACGHDAVFLHAGGSPQAYAKIKQLRLTALDCVNGPYEGSLYWRDPERRKNAGLEHSVLTDGPTVSSLLPTYKRVELTHADKFAEPLVFMADGETAVGEAAKSVSVHFSKYKTGVFTYDPNTGLYGIQQYGGPYVDGNTGEPVTVKNVLVLYTDVGNVKGDTEGRKTVRTTGQGQGQFFCDGTVQAITWSKDSDSAPMTYLDAQGKPLKLGVGHSYINIVDSSAEVIVS